MKPTREIVELVLAEMGDPDFESESASGLWWVSAYDAAGKHRAIGTGVSLEKATAGAWINVHLPDYCLEPLSPLLASAVPLAVPDDWSFEIDDCPAAGTA